MLSLRRIGTALLLTGMASLTLAADPPMEIVVQRGHKVSAAALSGDGRFVVTAGFDSAILWDAATGKMLRTFRGHEPSREVIGVAISGDGKCIVTGSDDETAIVWDAATGKKLYTLPGHTRGVTCLALCPDGKLLVTGSGSNIAFLWEVATGKKLQTFTVGNGKTELRSVALSGDGKTVAIVGRGSTEAELYDAATGKELKVLAGHKNYINSVVLSADGKRVATIGESRNVKTRLST